MKKVAAVLVLVALAVGAFVSITALMQPAEASTQAVPAPTTAQGYTNMFASVDPALWAGGDVSLSVPMADGRSVWLFGDTFSGNNEMVHSSAITQDGGTLHVSNHGQQVLPNDGPKDFYWIEQAEAVDADTLHVTAAPMRSTGEGVWDFQRRSLQSRVAQVNVDEQGNVHFAGWLKHVEAPMQYADLQESFGHYTYETRAHTEFQMASGKTLMTTNNNYATQQADKTFYRMTFTEGDGTEVRTKSVDASYLN